jgi:hypothetical protein
MVDDVDPVPDVLAVAVYTGRGSSAMALENMSGMSFSGKLIGTVNCLEQRVMTVSRP